MTDSRDSKKIKPLLYVINRDNTNLWNLLFSQQEVPPLSELKNEMEKQGFDEKTSQEIIKLWELNYVTIEDSEVMEESFKDIKFNPGHPIPGYLYRRHPLKSKKTTYVEYQSYYSLLLEEKQAELTKILFELGAREIYILNTTSSELKRQFGMQVNMGSTVKAEGSLGDNIKGRKKIDISLDLAFENIIGNGDGFSRLNYYNCVGKPWDKYMKINEKNYEWLHYSPDWDSIIKGRIDNQLTNALIRLTIDTHSTIIRNFSMKHGASFDAEIPTSASVSSEHKFQTDILSSNGNSNQSLRIIKVRFPEDFPENNRLLEYLRNNK
ncbi:MAG: hypothetical protein QNJ51_13845 [Calothrix sp. MO_167.B12]|nr:hypothetical protein [Calothrix sp. MO_167.B12]